MTQLFPDRSTAMPLRFETLDTRGFLSPTYNTNRPPTTIHGTLAKVSHDIVWVACRSEGQQH